MQNLSGRIFLQEKVEFLKSNIWFFNFTLHQIKIHCFYSPGISISYFDDKFSKIISQDSQSIFETLLIDFPLSLIKGDSRFVDVYNIMYSILIRFTESPFAYNYFTNIQKILTDFSSRPLIILAVQFRWVSLVKNLFYYFQTSQIGHQCELGKESVPVMILEEFQLD